jgi:hypothetical protein
VTHRTKLAFALPNFLDEIWNEQNSKQDQDGYCCAEVSLDPNCNKQERHDVPPPVITAMVMPSGWTTSTA